MILTCFDDESGKDSAHKGVPWRCDRRHRWLCPVPGRGRARDSPFEFLVTQACSFVLEVFHGPSVPVLSVRKCTSRSSGRPSGRSLPASLPCPHPPPAPVSLRGQGPPLLGARPRRLLTSQRLTSKHHLGRGGQHMNFGGTQTFSPLQEYFLESSSKRR